MQMIISSFFVDNNTAAPGSFLFSLRNFQGSPHFKAPLKDEYDPHAIYRSARSGPTFGKGPDLYISENSTTNVDSYALIGKTYHPPFGDSTEGKNTPFLLAEETNFSPSEVEVLYLN